MIGILTGKIIEKQPPEIVLDVHGIGYEILLPMTCFYALAELNQTVTLYTHLIIREDAHLLFGFITKQERTMFRELIKTNGVGPKLALAILSTMSAEQLIFSLEQEELVKLTQVPGIGKKTAERLLVELKGKFKHKNYAHTTNNNTGYLLDNKLTVKQEAIAALVTLGYRNNDAEKMIEKVYTDSDSAEQLIRKALKQV